MCGENPKARINRLRACGRNTTYFPCLSACEVEAIEQGGYKVSFQQRMNGTNFYTGVTVHLKTSNKELVL